MNILKIVSAYLFCLFLFTWGLNSSFKKSQKIHCETFGEYSRACEAIKNQDKLVEDF